MRPVPSLKRLIEAFGEKPGRNVRELLRGEQDPEGYESVRKWVAQCYNRPRGEELLMEAVNAALGGFGVEGLYGDDVDNFHFNVQACYVNMGDTYTSTILHDHVTGRYILTSYGDWIEAHGDERGIR